MNRKYIVDTLEVRHWFLAHGLDLQSEDRSRSIELIRHREEVLFELRVVSTDLVELLEAAFTVLLYRLHVLLDFHEHSAEFVELLADSFILALYGFGYCVYSLSASITSGSTLCWASRSQATRLGMCEDCLRLQATSPNSQGQAYYWFGLLVQVQIVFVDRRSVEKFVK